MNDIKMHNVIWNGTKIDVNSFLREYLKDLKIDVGSWW